MQWTMPHRVLQIVAALIGLAATASFVLGIVSAPQRGGRLPGEKLGGVAGAAIQATEATPLSNERIEGPPEPTAEEKAKADAEAAAKKAEADAGNTDDENAGDQASAGNAAAPPVVRPVVRPAPPAAGNTPPQTLGGPPAADEPPH